MQLTIHGNTASRRREPNGIVEEDGEDLSRPFRIAADRNLAGRPDFEVDALIGYTKPKTFDRFRKDHGQVERFCGHLQFAGVEPGYQKEVGEHSIHPVGLGEYVLDQFAIIRVYAPAVQHHLGVSPDQGEGGFELVGGVGHEGALLVERVPHRAHGPARHVEAAEGG
jgi:hypothetical protein